MGAWFGLSVFALERLHLWELPPKNTVLQLRYLHHLQSARQHLVSQ